MSNSCAVSLVCTECGHKEQLQQLTACSECFGPLSVDYDLQNIKKKDLNNRPNTFWRYQEFLPQVPDYIVDKLSFPIVPIKHLKSLGSLYGLDNLFIKDDTILPSGSFKDRPVSIAAGIAASFNFKALGCASTGNLAAAVARAATILNLPSYVFVPRSLPDSKITLTSVFGAKVVKIDGTYDTANRIANKIADQYNIGMVNVNLRPYYAEGSKTIVLEALEQLNWQSPDWIGVPLGSGALLSATYRTLEQLKKIDWINDSSRLLGSQPEGCTPIVDGFKSDTIKPVKTPNTIAESLAIGDPASGYEAIRAMKATKGAADAPSTEEVKQAIYDLAKTEGMWTEPAGATVLASIKRLKNDGRINKNDRIVAFITGAGWKTSHLLDDIFHTKSYIVSNEKNLGKIIGLE